MNVLRPVERLTAADAEEVLSVLVDAFTGYPVMEYVLGPGPDGRLEPLLRLFVMARVFRDEPLFGVREGSRLIAAAIASFPSSGVAPEAFETLREKTWRLLGPEVEQRYTMFRNATAPFPFPTGSVHLNMVGARRTHQRKGIGRRIIAAVQEISRARPGSDGVSLTTEHLANVPYYTRLGFELVGHAQVGPGLETWGFFRRDDVGG